MPGRYSAAPMMGTIQWMLSFEVNPKMRTLVGMKILAIRPISRRISGPMSTPAAAALANLGAMWYFR